MGIKSSAIKPSGVSSENVEKLPNLDSLKNYYGDMLKIDFLLFQDLLVDILSFVPAKDLVRNCRLVSKKWKDLIDSQSVWKLKCEREKKCIPKGVLEILPDRYYLKIYFNDPYGRNLIRNSCGEQGLQHWKITQNGGDGITAQNPPAGSDPVPKEVGSESCFATSYDSCAKHQILSLLDLGVNKEILQLDTTQIEIGEWYAARFDCAAEYRLDVILLDDLYDVEDETLFAESNIVDHFEFSFTEDQWVGKEWHFVNHVFKNVGRVRYIYFQHSGKDRQFWAGHYGMKMTGAYVKVIA